MGRPIGCTTASELAIRSYLTEALHHHGAWCPPCSLARNFAKAGFGPKQ